MTTVYLIRHSEKFDIFKKMGKYNSDENPNGTFKSRMLSINGEKRAEILGKELELQNLDAVYASTYARSMQTAKYLSEPQNLPLNIDKDFDEITEGDVEADKWVEECDKQYADLDYKANNGESHNDVDLRFTRGFWNAIEEYRGKRIAIVSHGCAITCFLNKYVEWVRASQM